MLEDGLRSFLLFAGAIFVVLNGPLWVTVRIRVFAGVPEAPVWLHQGVFWASRLAGIAMLAAWAWDATGTLRFSSLLWAILAMGLFCLLDGPVRLITQAGILHRGREAPAWLEHVGIWFIRLVGVSGLLGALVIGLLATAG